LKKQPGPKPAFLRQNEYPLIENGGIVIRGAYPEKYDNFSDDILRSYLISADDGKYFGYLWSNYVPPLF